MSPGMHVLRSQLDSDTVRRIRIDLMQLHARLAEMDPVGSMEARQERITAANLQEKTLSLLTALRNL